MSNTLFIVAGESSGDMRAAELLTELRKINPSLRLEGYGSSAMQASGVKIHYDLPSVAVVGFTDVIKKYPFFRKIFYSCLETIDKIKPKAVMLVDYPGFNLRLARQLKKRNIPVIYYVSPQVWAWANWRVKEIARNINKMLVILPFEVDFYKKTSLDVEFVGHPLIDKFKPSNNIEVLRKNFNISNEKTIIAILSGSRKKEVKRILPITLKAAEIISKIMPNVVFIISKTPHLSDNLYEKIIASTPIKYSLASQNMHDIIAVSDFCWVTSGTATLETALGLKPHFIIYKTTLITFYLAKLLVTIPFLGLINIVAGNEIIPEFIQNKANPKIIAKKTIAILSDPKKTTTIVNNLKETILKMGKPNAAENAAKAVQKFLAK